jgi:hypothetical protein
MCDACWALQLAHRPGKTNIDGLPHEKADWNVVRRLRDILAPPEDQRQRHLADQDSTWFGVGQDDNARPVLRDNGLLASIIGETTSTEFQQRYPRLVSFVGQTGAGKSAIVKMLIDQKVRPDDPTHPISVPCPVVASPGSDISPTSGDVHLYADPKTCFGQHPLLYADCEGLDGGESLPMSAKYCSGPGSRLRDRDESCRPRRHPSIDKVGRCSQRIINWANSAETRKRQ